ncbi:MAG: TRAP transporter substrate-binding protein [Burkholderiaceae bacterium]
MRVGIGTMPALAVLVMLGLASGAAAAQSKKVVELRAGTSTPKGDMLADGVERYAEAVNRLSKGEINVRVFYQSLGVEQQLAQAVMSGSVDIGTMSSGNTARFSSAFLVYDLPFMFKRYENLLRAIETPIGKQLERQAEKDLGVKYLYHISYGVGRDIQTTKKPLRTPKDVAGLKIRVLSSPIDLATFKAWGANPTPVDWTQTFAALQQGVVDGEQISLSTIVGAKHYEVVKHNIRLDYQASFQTLFINANRFASLSPAHQKILLDAAQETKAWQHKDAAERLKLMGQELSAKHGMQLYVPTPEEYAQWASIREQVWKQVAAEQGSKLSLETANTLYRQQE